MINPDIESLSGPFVTLKPGQTLTFELFPEVPPDTIKLRSGVLLEVEVQVAPLQNGDTTVQTLLHLVSRKDFDLGVRVVQEKVPLEALLKVQVELSEEEILSDWVEVVPALGGGRNSSLSPVDVKALMESRKLSGLHAPKAGKKASKNSSVKEAPQEMYISRKRR